MPDRDQFDATSLEKPSNDPGIIHIYTDGSRRDGIAGAGVYCQSPSLELCIPQGRFASVFQAEVNAIYMALDYLISNNTLGKNISIFSDSAAAIKALQREWIKSRTVAKCKQLAKYVGSTNTLSIKWVPGHTGIAGNEAADRLAGSGTSPDFQGPEPFVRIPLSSIKQLADTYISFTASSLWISRGRYRQTRQFSGHYNPLRSKLLLKLNRNMLRQVLYLLTGHGPFCRHLNKMGLSDSSSCALCGESDTAFHFIGERPAYTASRSLCLGSASLRVDEVRSISVKQMGSFLRTTRRFQT